MSPNCMCRILTQATAALPIIKEQISSPLAVHLHMFRLPKDWVALQYMHYHSCIPGESGQMKLSRTICHHHLQHHSIFLCWGSVTPSPTSASVSDNPCMENLGAPSSGAYSPFSSGEYISPESSHLSESITGAQ